MGSKAAVKARVVLGKAIATCWLAGNGLVVLFLKKAERTGPPIIAAGRAMTRPHNKVWVGSAASRAASVVGAGWGGKRAWVIDKAATMGKARYLTGYPVLCTRPTINGYSKIKAAL